MKSVNKFIACIFASLLLTISSTNTAFSDEALKTALSIQNVFISVAERLKPSVVNIRIEKEQQTGIRWITPDQDEEENNFGLENFFQRFFRSPRFAPPLPELRNTQAAGSGLIIDPSGIILTNNHVIDNAKTISVKFHDGDELDAEIIGQDPQTDIALIKVTTEKKLQAATFADSDEVKVGQWAIAVGNPLGLEQTVTVGVVSAIGRSGIGATTIEDFIQTDASINPGNSGGPLVDLNGKVIGINSLIFNAPGSGIGFAIPSNMAHRIAQQISTTGAVQRPYIGITMQPVTEQLASHYNLKNKNGAVVLALIEDGPAAKAGVKEMDIILEIDNKPMYSTNDVQKYVLTRDVDSSIQVSLLRNGKQLSLNIELEQMPVSYGLAKAFEKTNLKNKSNFKQFKGLGFNVRELDKEEITNLKLSQDEALIVSEIKSSSPAEKAGLKTGDLITQVNSRAIQNTKDLEKALEESSKKDSSVFLVKRGDIPMFLVIPHK